MLKLCSSVTMCFPEGKTKAFTMSFDDAPVQDKRLVALMNENGIRSTFNLSIALLPDVEEEGPDYVGKKPGLDAIFDLYRGHEIASHGQVHAKAARMPLPSAVYDTIEGKRLLEKHFKTVVSGYAYPYMKAPFLAEVLPQCGVLYARDVDSTRAFLLPQDWYWWHPTCHYHESCVNELAEKFVSTPSDKVGQDPWLFYVWGHSYEMDQNNDWAHIEALLKKLGNRDDVWYATNLEIYNYVEAFRSLRFSIDTDYVYNPSSVDVWIRHSAIQTPIFIPAGGTVSLFD